jgi:putative hydrolase of the HAD superfamily
MIMNNRISQQIDGPIAGVLLDMDDTLFLEHSYVISGIAAVAEFLSDRTDEPANEIAARVTYQFLKYGRRQLFDNELGEPSVSTIEDIVRVYRNHVPDIKLFEGAAENIAALTRQFPVAVVTDGAQVMQYNKVRALGLDDLVSEVVYCDALNAPKPKPDAFIEAAKLLGVEPSACVLIGDDPTADMVGAQAAGMAFIRVLTGRYGLFRAQTPYGMTVRTFSDAAKVLLRAEKEG